MYSHLAAATTDPAIQRYHDVKPWANAASKHSRTKLTRHAVIAQFGAPRVDRTHNQNLRCGRCQLTQYYSTLMTLRVPVIYNPVYFILPSRSYKGSNKAHNALNFLQMCLCTVCNVVDIDDVILHATARIDSDSGYDCRK